MKSHNETGRITLWVISLIGFLVFLIWILWFGTSDKVKEVLVNNFNAGILLWIVWVIGFVTIADIFYKIVTYIFYPESKEEKARSIKLKKIQQDYNNGKISKNERRYRKKMVEIEYIENGLKRLKKEVK